VPSPRRTAVALAAVAALVVGVGGTALVAVDGAVDTAVDVVAGAALAGVDRVDGVVEARPPGAPTDDGTTFLLVGSDARGELGGLDGGAWEVGSQRSDVMLLARLTSGGDLVLVSLPRDLWVDVPGHGSDKLNAAFSYGGPALLVDTVEQLTGLHVDHYAAVGFDGLKALTDAVGGVTVESPRASEYQGHEFVVGENELDGEGALAFVRQRKNLPRGDLDRVENQQRYLLALLDELGSPTTLQDPRRLAGLAAVARDEVVLDAAASGSDLLALGQALGGPDGEVVTGTVPVVGTGTERGLSVVHLDEPGSARLWAALGEDDVEAVGALL